MIIGSITITSLDPIGNAVANDTLIPVVNMDGVPTTQKMTVANLLQSGLGANLGPVANVKIQGGTNGYVLQTDGAGNLTWTTQIGSGNGSVGGANTQVQFNDSGNFGGNSGFTFDKTAGALASPMIDTAAVYHLAGTVIENADLTHGATSALIIPSNGNTTSPAQLNNFYGNVVVQAAVDVDHIKTWTFDKTGNLNLPGNTFAINYANGSAVPLDSYGNSNVATFLEAYGSNTMTTTGNVSVGNLLTTGVVSATGNVRGGNLNTDGNVSATGNIRGGNLYVSGTGTSINASQGNILTNEVTGTKFNFMHGLYTTSVSANASANYTLSLPPTAGTNGQVLTTDGTGDLSWTTVSSGGNTANVTFSDYIVQGRPGYGLGLASTPDDAANLKYLQVRAGDIDSHIHFDTGNNQAYDQYFGDDNKYVKLERGLAGNVLIGTYQDGGIGPLHWTFDSNGNLTLPENGRIKAAGNVVPFNTAITGMTSGSTTVVVTVADNIFSDQYSGQVTISGVNSPLQSNDTWWYLASTSNSFQLYYDEALTAPVDGTTWPAFGGGGTADSVGSAMAIIASNVTIDTGLGNSWTFGTNGVISIPEGSASWIKGRIQSANGYPTLLGYGSAPEHGGPELDWMNGDNPNDMSNNSVLRNTLYINENGFYVGMNENNFDVANNFTGSWRFASGGSLTIPAGNANNIVSGQIFSDNESSFINLDVQFDSNVLGGMRLGTSGTKPVDIVTGNGNGGFYTWRFDSNGEITTPDGTLIGAVEGPGTFGFYNANANTDFLIELGSSNVWSFNGASGITGLPNNTLQTGANVVIKTPSGVPASLANWNGGGGWNQGSYINLATTGGTGTGLTVDVAAGGGGYISINEISIHTPGTGYTNGDVITITNENNIPGTFTVTVTNNEWTFEEGVGNTTMPGNVVIGTGNAGVLLQSNTSDFGFYANITGITSGNPTVIVTLSGVEFPGPLTGTVRITGVQGEVEANDFWYWQAVEVDQIQLFTDSARTTPADGTTWGAYAGGGIAVSSGYNNLDISGGNVSIISGAGKFWSFNPDGGFVPPILNIDLHNGGNQQAQLLQFGDPTKQAVITGPTPAYGSSAQRLIIQGQRGSGGGEGGDVYVWGGDSDLNGGDIKIYAGDSDGATGGGGYINLSGGQGADTGGYINIDGGYGSNGSGGYVNITGGTGGNSYGGYINIQGGQSAGTGVDGGNIVLQGGYSQSANGGPVILRGGQSALGLPGYGNVYIDAGASQWTFDNVGNTTVPGNIVFNSNIYINNGFTLSTSSDIGGQVDYGNHTVGYAADNNGTSALYARDSAGQGNHNAVIVANGVSGTALIRTSNEALTNYDWVFESAGTLTLPTISLGDGINEQAIVQSQRKVIPPYRYSAVIDGSTPTIVYTAKQDSMTIKTTLVVQHGGGVGFEMFDVSAVAAGSNVIYSVSNRLNATGQPDTTAVVDWEGTQLAITLTVNSGATTSWVTYDSTEFGIAVD